MKRKLQDGITLAVTIGLIAAGFSCCTGATLAEASEFGYQYIEQKLE